MRTEDLCVAAVVGAGLGLARGAVTLWTSSCFLYLEAAPGLCFAPQWSGLEKNFISNSNSNSDLGW